MQTLTPRPLHITLYNRQLIHMRIWCYKMYFDSWIYLLPHKLWKKSTRSIKYSRQAVMKLSIVFLAQQRAMFVICRMHHVIATICHCICVVVASLGKTFKPEHCIEVWWMDDCWTCHAATVSDFIMCCCVIPSWWLVLIPPSATVAMPLTWIYYAY